ncbi:MAG: hypothetical protein Q9168_000157 [Polycauliona sp. 1 TL-2023]
MADRYPKTVVGVALSGVSAAAFYLFRVRVDPAIVAHMEDLIAATPTPTIPLDILPSPAALQPHLPGAVTDFLDHLLSGGQCKEYVLCVVIAWLSYNRYQAQRTVAYRNKEITIKAATISTLEGRVADTAAQTAEDADYVASLRRRLRLAKFKSIKDAFLLKKKKSDLAEAKLTSKIQLAKLLCEKNEIAERNTLLEGKNAKLEGDKEEIGKANEELKEKIAKLERQNKESANENEELNKKMRQQEQNNAELEEKNGELEFKRQQLEKRNAELGEITLGLEKRNAELDEHSKGLEKKNEEVKEKNGELDSKCQQLEKRNAELDEHSKGLEKKHAELAEKNDEFESKCQQLEKRNAELDEHSKGLEKKNNEVGEKNQELGSKCQQLQAEKAELDERIVGLERNNDQLEEKTQKLNVKAHLFGEREKILKADQISIKAMNDTYLNTMHCTLEVEKTAMKTPAKKASSNLQSVRAREGELKSQHRQIVEGMNIQNISLQDSLAKAQATVKGQQGALLEYEDKMEQRASDILIPALDTVVYDLHDCISILKKDLAAAQSAHSDAISKCESLGEESQRKLGSQKLQNMITQAALLNALQTEVKNKDRRIEALEASSVAMQEDCKESTPAYDELSVRPTSSDRSERDDQHPESASPALRQRQINE